MIQSIDEEREKLYHDKYFRTLAECYREKTGWERNRIKNVIELSRPKFGELVLDLGCGIGVFTIEAAKYGAFTIGLDYSLNAIKYGSSFAKELGMDNLTFVGADAQHIPLKNETFDLIICADLVEHLNNENLMEMLKESHRILKNGGRLAIYTPSPTHIFEIMMKHNFILKKDESHIGLRKIGEIKDFVEKAGFKIIKAYHRPTHIPIFSLIERIFMHIPLLGGLAKRRTCILAIKR